MSDYQLVVGFGGKTVIKRLADGVFIPEDERNKDYREYQAWVAQGNTPLPAEPPPQVAIDTRDANQRLDAGIDAAQEPLAAADAAGKRTARTTEDQLAALQAQVDALQQAMQSMLDAQLGKTPR